MLADWGFRQVVLNTGRVNVDENFAVAQDTLRDVSRISLD
jgi:hypothetical protein